MAITHDCKYIRLTTGEDILSKCMVAYENIVLTNPVRVIAMPNKLDPSNPNIGLAPLFPYTQDEKITIDMDHVLAIMDPIKAFSDQYASIFSKIALPPKGLILPK